MQNSPLHIVYIHYDYYNASRPALNRGNGKVFHRKSNDYVADMAKAFWRRHFPGDRALME
jgi:hypothetical protein